MIIEIRCTDDADAGSGMMIETRCTDDDDADAVAGFRHDNRDPDAQMMMMQVQA